MVTYGYNAVGKRITMESDFISLGYTFDSAYRLTGVTNSLGQSFGHDYDLNGNLTSKQEKGLSGKVWTYTYSSENQLVLSEEFEGTVKLKRVEYFYDAFGRRIKKSVQDLQNSRSFERKYAYDSSEIIAELDEDNNVLARHTHSGLRTDDVLTSEITSTGVSAGLAESVGSYLYLKDGLGSVMAVTTTDGDLVQRYVYSSFGKLLKTVDGAGLERTSFKIAYTYTNRELDEETGLYYYRARYYDPGVGRFLTEDPHPGKISSPVTFNSKYIYAGNNPIMNVDPSGKFIIAAMVIGAIIGGVIADANGGNFLEGALIGAAAGGVGAFVGGAVGLGVGNAVSGAIGGTAGSVFGGVAAFGAGAFVGGSVGGLAGGAVGAGIGAVNGRGAEEGLFYGLGLGFSVGAITGGLSGLASYAYGDFLFNDVDFGVNTAGIRTNSVQRYMYKEAYGTTSGLLKILEGPSGTEYLPLF